jgi:hypothetical protein
MRLLDRVVAWVIILLGVRFALVAPHLFANTEWPWSTGFWLVNCAVLFAMCGAVHLARIRYAAVAPGLRHLASEFSVVIACLQVVAGVVGGEAVPAGIVGLVLLASAALSVRPSSPLVAG